jgi:Lon-like ATP-dependent protease
MKFEETESVEDSNDTVVEPDVVETGDGNETKPMLDYNNIKSSQDIEVPPLLIDQVIGHKESIETIKKAAKQRRNVLLIGDPGVGKSMLAKGMAQILPHETLQDILVYPNMEDNNHPLIRSVPAGEGKKIVRATKMNSMPARARK